MAGDALWSSASDGARSLALPHAGGVRLSMASIDGSQIGRLLPQRQDGAKAQDSPVEPGSPGDVRTEEGRAEGTAAAVSAAGQQVLAEAAEDLDERLARLQAREAELAALVAEDREEAARAQQEREEQEARAANAGREAMIEMHRRRVQFAPGGPHDSHEQEEDSLYARSQPGASRRKLRSATAAAEEEVRNCDGL